MLSASVYDMFERCLNNKSWEIDTTQNYKDLIDMCAVLTLSVYVLLLVMSLY